MKHVTSETPRRITTYPGETADEYVRAREQAQGLLAFEAKRLVDNGWTANLERGYQKNAKACHASTPDSDKLIAALEIAEQARNADQAKRADALRAAQAKQGQPDTQAPPAPQMAAQDATEGPVWDEEDPGADLQFEPYKI